MGGVSTKSLSGTLYGCWKAGFDRPSSWPWNWAYRAATHKVGQMAGARYREERQRRRGDESREQEFAWAVQNRCPIGKDKRAKDVTGPLFSHPRAGSQNDQLRLPLDHFERRRPFDPVFSKQSFKGRGLEDFEPDVEAHSDHNDAQQERDTPPPNQELVARNRAADSLELATRLGRTPMNRIDTAAMMQRLPEIRKA
jgi:hypothetical protein